MYIYIYIISIYLYICCIFSNRFQVYVEGDLCFEMRANTKPITSNLASPLGNLENYGTGRNIMYVSKYVIRSGSARVFLLSCSGFCTLQSLHVFAPNINQIKRNALCTSCFANTIVQTIQSSILTISNCPKYGFKHTQNTCINRKCGTQYSLPLEISWTRNRGYMKNHY